MTELAVILDLNRVLK